MYDDKRVLPLLQERSHVLFSCRIAFRGGDVVPVGTTPALPRRGRACSFGEARRVGTQALTHTACTCTVITVNVHAIRFRSSISTSRDTSKNLPFLRFPTPHF